MMIIKDRYDVVIVGSGPAGLAAASTAAGEGASVLLLERNHILGGILNQCIHAGFGIHDYGLELTGPEYAHRLASRLGKLNGIEALTDTMVLGIAPDRNVITVSGPVTGRRDVSFGSLILATGCRERTRPNILLPGSRPAGVLTAGTAQYYVNMLGMLPGRNIVILGSGDVGLIMARRFTLEGAHVECVCEIMPKPGGLLRNVSQCLDDFGIPLLLSTTVKEIHGRKRISGVTLVKVNPDNRGGGGGGELVPGTERFVECDTLILSVGLIPENELARSAGIIPLRTGGLAVDEGMMCLERAGIFACGNCVHVNDIADFAAIEGLIAGKNAATHAREGALHGSRAELEINAGENISYVVPHRVRFYDTGDGFIDFSMRVRNSVQDCTLELADYEVENTVLFSKKFRIVRPDGMLRVRVPREKLANAKEAVVWRLASKGAHKGAGVR